MPLLCALHGQGSCSTTVIGDFLKTHKKKQKWRRGEILERVGNFRWYLPFCIIWAVRDNHRLCVAHSLTLILSQGGAKLILIQAICTRPSHVSTPSEDPTPKAIYIHLLSFFYFVPSCSASLTRRLNQQECQYIKLSLLCATPAKLCELVQSDSRQKLTFLCHCSSLRYHGMVVFAFTSSARHVLGEEWKSGALFSFRTLREAVETWRLSAVFILTPVNKKSFLWWMRSIRATVRKRNLERSLWEKKGISCKHKFAVFEQ